MPEFLTSWDPCILLWLILIIVFVVVELISVGLTCIWFAAGALAALIFAILGAGFGIQFLVFLAVSAVLLFLTRPWAKKYINGRMQKTNSESLPGQVIRISERVDNAAQTGMAVVNGQEWTVRSADDKVTLEEGASARILEISGVKLIVERIKEEKE